MNRATNGLLAAVLALGIGFFVAFMVSPDPTGVVPALLGILLTAVLTPLLYVSLRRPTGTDRE